MRDDTATTPLTGTAGGPVPHGMEAIRIPEVSMPFPAHEPNPALPRAEAALDAWLDASGLCQSPASRRSLKRTRMPLVTALCFPDAAPEVLDMLIEWATWSFLVDDEFDDGPDGAEAVRCAAALATLVPVLDGAQPTDTASAQAFARTLERLTNGRSAAWSRMLRHDIGGYLWSFYAGLIDQLAHRIPTVTAYRRQRAVTIAAYTWLDLVEASASIDLPETVRRLSSFRDLRDAASEYVGLCNDMWSLERDKRAGGFHNVVLLVQYHEQLTLQEAVDEVNDMLTDCAHRMLDAERDLTAQLDAAHITGQARADALTCVEGYCKFVRGVFDYYYSVDRYTIREPDQAGEAAPVHQLFQTGNAVSGEVPPSRQSAPSAKVEPR